MLLWGSVTPLLAQTAVEHCGPLHLRASARALVLTHADRLLMLPECFCCCRAGWQDFGARDPTAGELGSNFGDKVLGNYNTEHIIKCGPGAGLWVLVWGAG